MASKSSAHGGRIVAGHAARAASLMGLICSLLTTACDRSQKPQSETITFQGGKNELRALLYKPDGAGPFPAVLYNHGSAPGLANNEAFDAIAPTFVSRGWVFFAPYRRGQGLSANAGPYIMDEIRSARGRGGTPAAAETMTRLLVTDHLDDQIAALDWLRTQSFVRPNAIATMGNSFGGIQAVLGADHGGYCAAVDAAGGAESWKEAPQLRELMIRAVRNATPPILFFQAANDFDVEPSRVLFAERRAAGKVSEIRIYPAFGDSARTGHSFPYRGVGIWRDDVIAFLDRHCMN
jgi:carboxymethylenebutenolidase